MNIEVPKEVFDEVRKNFLELDLIHVDEAMRDILDRWKNVPDYIANQVVPRWSCQGHSRDSGDDSMYIIFMTRNDGYEMLLKMMNFIAKERCKRNGAGTLAGTHLSILNLMYETEDQIYNNVQLSTINAGVDEFRNRALIIWNEALDKLIAGEL